MRKSAVLILLMYFVLLVSSEGAILRLDTELDRESLVNAMRNDADFYFSLGSFLADKGYLLSAARFIRTGLAMDDKSKTAHHNLGVVLYRQGKLDLAESEFRKAIQLDSGYGKAHYSLALLQIEQEKLEEALMNLKKVTKLEPDNHNAFFDTGIVLGRLNRFEEAKEYFSKAYEINNDFAEAKQNVEFLVRNSRR